ncbi:MAG TPA: hypothetical protein VHK90_03570, partial [Thermoanaerobaculia bacterium]|nr:hypothetical protein [Thermoanaerobaculia bacterium]
FPRGAKLAYSAHIAGADEVPVVRAGDTSWEIELPHIEIADGSRARLRVYDFDGRDREVEVEVTRDDGTVRHWPVTLQGGFAAVDLAPDARVLDVRVVSPLRDARLWAFVSVTHNETQRVTLYTPQ